MTPTSDGLKRSIRPCCIQSRSLLWASAWVLMLVQLVAPVEAQFKPTARWGHASALANNTLYIHGGKVDEYNTYSYTTAPNSNDLFSLDLSTSFDLSNPPWKYISGSSDPSTSQGPAVAWHTLSPYTSSNLLVFGGDGGPAMPIQTKADSAWTLDIATDSSASWSGHSEGWASQPERRTFHSAAVAKNGHVWITGGQRVDGSALGFRDTYAFDPQVPSFTGLSTASNSMPPALVGHQSVVLPSGLLLVMGGYSSDLNALLPLSVIFFLDLKESSPTWGNITVGGDVPPPRRNFAAAVLDGNRVLIHGGSDAAVQSIYNDGAILDISRSPISWVSANGLSEWLGPRVDHTAIGLGNNVLFGFGRGPNGPADDSWGLYDSTTGTFDTQFVPSSSSGAQTTGDSTATSAPTLPTGTGASTLTVAPTGTTSALLPGQSSHSARPTPGLSTEDTEDNQRRKVLVVALGTVFGILALVLAVGGSTYWYLKHRGGEWRRGQGFNRLIPRGNPDPEVATTTGEKLPVAGSTWVQPPRGWDLMGIVGGKPSPPKQRFDMLVDEDSKEFGRREASQSTSTSGFIRPTYERLGSSSRRLWDEVANASATSLKSVSAALGVNRREASDKSPDWWEKGNPFADQDARLLASVPTVTSTGMAARPRGGQGPSESSSFYRDPFNDMQAIGHSRQTSGASDISSPGFSSYLPIAMAAATENIGLPAPTPVHPLSIESHISPPGSPVPHLATVRSTSSISRSLAVDSAGSDTVRLSVSTLSHDPTSTLGRSTMSSPISPVSIISSAPSAPVKRSDSWWARFSRSSLVDRNASGEPIPQQGRKISFTRRGSQSRSDGGPTLDFRDPRPPPKLPPVVETGLSADPSPESGEGGKKDKAKALLGYGSHSKSLSSVKTGKTATSDALEKVARGRYDIVQHLRTDSGSYSSTPASSIREDRAAKDGALQLVKPSPNSVNDPKKKGSGDNSTVNTGTDEYYTAASQTPTPTTPHSAPPIPPRLTKAETDPTDKREPRPVKRSQTAVLARVADIESRAREIATPIRSSTGLASPGRPREKGGSTSPTSSGGKGHTAVGWGLAERAPLFVANPDSNPPSASTKGSPVS